MIPTVDKFTLIKFCFFTEIRNLIQYLQKISANGSADLRSPEKEVYFRSWDFAHHQIYKSIFDAQKLIKKKLTHPKAMTKESQRKVKGKCNECQ